MEFDCIIGAVDDDFFVPEAKKSVKLSSEWKPKSLNYRWYREVETVENAPEENRVHIQLCQASYYYLNNEFANAADLYRQAITMLPPSALKIHREAYEGLARTSVYLQNYSEASKAIEKLEFLCKTRDHQAISYNVNAVYHHEKGDFESEVKYHKLAVLIHPFNPDLWLKLAKSYASLNNLTLNSLGKSNDISLGGIRDFKPPGTFKDWTSVQKSSSEIVPLNPVQLIAACLVRAGVIIHSTLSTANDYVKRQDLTKLQRICWSLREIEVEEELIEKAIRFYSFDVYGLEELASGPSEGEFKDMGSSAYVESEDVGQKDKESVETFDKQWLSWL